MSLIIQTLIIGIVSAGIYFLLSPTIAEWVVWFGYLFFAIVLFFKGLEYRRELLQGKETDWTGATMLPPAMILITLILILFLFLEYNKLNLLWIAPLATFIVEQIITKIVIGNSEKQILNKITKR